MSRPAHKPSFDSQGFLARETGQANRHEYHDDEVFAVTCASETPVYDLARSRVEAQSV